MLTTITTIAIDSIQEVKKQLVSTLVKHDQIAEIFNQFIDNQTAYTKEMVENTIETNKNFFSLITEPEFYKEIAESISKLGKKAHQ